jgi:hypothetical protein
VISKLAYLEFPGPGRYRLSYQPFGSNDLTQVEIPAEQMRLILISGMEMMLRESFHPVPITQTKDAAQ